MTDQNNTIEVYWSPATYDPEQESWSFLYLEPLNVFSNLVKNNKHGGVYVSCPASKQMLKNTYSINSAIDDTHILPKEIMASLAYQEETEYLIPTNGKVPIRKERKSSYDGYINISYNLKWLFFASEPVEARWTAPYFPASSPVHDALFSAGQMNIGQWFRPLNLDWHIPINSDKFEVYENQPLAFLEIMTDKKVEFKRFQMNKKIINISQEFSQSPIRYGKFKTLKHKYSMASKSKTIDILLKEIRKTLI